MYISRYAVNSWGFLSGSTERLLYAGCQFHYLYQFGMRHCRNHAFRGGIRQVIQRAPKCSRTDIRIDKYTGSLPVLLVPGVHFWLDALAMVLSVLASEY